MRTLDRDELLDGAIDLHVHGYPDMGMAKQSRVGDFEVCELARDAGLRALVFKSHFWPTMDRAFQLNERLASESFTVYSSIVLNPLAGSLSPMSVEVAAAHAAKLVYLPTWGCCHDHEQRGTVRKAIIEPQFPSIVRALDANGALSMLDQDGALVPELHDIIALCREKRLTLCTGHVSPRESLAVLRAAKDRGLEKVIATHPMAPSIGATLDECKRFIELGALIEFTFAGTVSLFNPLAIRAVASAIRALGPQHCLLTTDVFFEYLPPEPEALRMFAHQLHFIGVTSEEIRTMIVHNPARLLDLE